MKPTIRIQIDQDCVDRLKTQGPEIVEGDDVILRFEWGNAGERPAASVGAGCYVTTEFHINPKAKDGAGPQVGTTGQESEVPPSREPSGRSRRDGLSAAPSPVHGVRP